MTFMERRDWVRVSMDVPSCMNTCSSQGICDEFSTNASCICLVDYTGAECTQELAKEREYAEVMNGTFTFAHYIGLHYHANGTAKHAALLPASGLAVESKNSLLAGVGFEVFWTEVVDHVFGEIGPEEHFLRDLSCEQFGEETLGSDFQRVYFYAKYANETIKVGF